MSSRRQPGEEVSSSSEEEVVIPIPPKNFQFRRSDLLRRFQRLYLYSRHSIFTEIGDTLRVIGGDDLVERFKRTTMGVFMQICRRNSANAALHHLLARELTGPQVPMLERWFLVSGRIIRFTPEAFCLITGLYFGPTDFDPTAAHLLSDGSLYKKFFGKATKASKLRSSFTGLKLGEDPNDYLKAANLLVFYFFLLCRDDPGVEYWTCEDPKAWESYPWGAYTYLNLIYYIANVATATNQSEKAANLFYGVAWAFQLWSYEAIPQLGRLCGQRRVGDNIFFPRCLIWETDQSKADFSGFFDRRNLTVVEVLQPGPLELYEPAWASLEVGGRFDVHYEPPVRIGLPAVQQAAAAPLAAPLRSCSTLYTFTNVSRTFK